LFSNQNLFFSIEQLSSSDDLPEGWSGDCLICPGNTAFKCYNANNSLSCPKDSIEWNEIFSMLTGVSHLSLQEKIETLTW
jgi:hypothetical protein